MKTMSSEFNGKCIQIDVPALIQINAVFVICHDKEEKEDRPIQIQELEANRLKKDALAAGAGDTDLIVIARESMAAYPEDLLKVMPETVCVLCLVFRVNQLALRSTEHSVVDLEFK